MKTAMLPKAIKRLNEIYNYIRKRSVIAAAGLYNDILDEIDILKRFPAVAAIEPLLAGEGKTYRSLVVRKHYKIIYYIDEMADTVYVVTIWDCRKNPKTLKEEILIIRVQFKK
jgi:plasmid stabilization system protein ParE